MLAGAAILRVQGRDYITGLRGIHASYHLKFEQHVSQGVKDQRAETRL
jgi:hypothetical protein